MPAQTAFSQVRRNIFQTKKDCFPRSAGELQFSAAYIFWLSRKATFFAVWFFWVSPELEKLLNRYSLPAIHVRRTGSRAVVKWFQLSRTFWVHWSKTAPSFMQNLLWLPRHSDLSGNLPLVRFLLHAQQYIVFIIRFYKRMSMGFFGNLHFLTNSAEGFRRNFSKSRHLSYVMLNRAIPHKERLATLHAILLANFPSYFIKMLVNTSSIFLFHLTKNLTTHLSHNLCAVLP